MQYFLGPRKIFQPFFRVDDSRESSTGGAGLGLAIATRAVGVHRGTMWARNADPGLQVWMELPLAGSGVHADRLVICGGLETRPAD